VLILTPILPLLALESELEVYAISIH